MKLTLKVDGLADSIARENFVNILRVDRANALNRGSWRFFEISFLGAVTNFKLSHHLGFAPKDIIQTSLIGAGSLQWNYSLFDSDSLDITTTGACVVRCFIGTYAEGSAQ